MPLQPKRRMAVEPVLTVPEVCGRFRKSPKTIWRMIHAKEFRGVRKVGRDFLIPVRSVEAVERAAERRAA